MASVQKKKPSIALRAQAIGCPNPNCGELTLSVAAWYAKGSGGQRVKQEEIGIWKLLPESNAKPIPEYVPEAIRDAYQQAARIVELSPNASAALSRRCLQGIIRDFWNLPEGKRGKLGAEISSLSDQIDPELLKEIEAIRAIGDIGAHMDKHVDMVVDVEPEEARLLVALIEILIDRWYVNRKKRSEQTAKLHEIVANKRAQKRKNKQEKKASDGPSVTNLENEQGT
ncbi:hypothetical protein GCM10011587_11460 [Pyruvatibacter mobilis]|nr:hypothetical protein GCM10011587_11460 [Pyruvatibacter mobilis]